METTYFIKYKLTTMLLGEREMKLFIFRLPQKAQLVVFSPWLVYK